MQKRKIRRTPPRRETGNSNSNKLIWVAVIGAIGTILAATIPAVIEFVASNQNSAVATVVPATFTPSQTSIITNTSVTDAPRPTSTLTANPTDTPTLTMTPLVTPTVTLTRTFTPRPTDKFTATSSLDTDQMTASLVANLYVGSAPVNIGFNARDSSVQFANGGSAECGNTPFCSYVFTIRLGSQQKYTESNTSGRITYNFTQKGQYTVDVNVCRGNACDYALVTVEIK